MKYISTYFDKDLSSDITQSRIKSVVAAFVGILVLAFFFNHEGIFHILHSIGIICYYTTIFIYLAFISFTKIVHSLRVWNLMTKKKY